MVPDFHFLFNVSDLSRLVDEECYTAGETSVVNAICFCSCGRWIAENRVIQIQAFCELRIRFDGVTTRCKISNVELLDLIATFTK